ncbi:unannotated protein [freshwater metagenome]|jgi:transcriptional regulator with XRE-family HTH domain|uniref:Unannotated protein n=1 Tax=freshwater metagenome TaxID=449393 RepID=A0A6J7GH90_9ZZZZ|nr:transcriptional regulator [Actinomycetota bacterium]
MRTETPQMADQISDERSLLAAEMALSALRERAGVSQAELAARLRDNRHQVAAAERADYDLRLATVARYVEALGGTLRLVATVDGQEIGLDLGALDF